jgi:regulatory protein YycI of two-component signal transduction system YycFG
MIVTILAKLKSKLAVILIVILTTLLTATYLDRKSIMEDRDSVKESLVEQVTINKRLSDENKSMAEEIKNKPKEFITITKETMVNICDAKVKQEAIKALPHKPKEVQDETHVAGMDDSLPDDLIRLLR